MRPLSSVEVIVCTFNGELYLREQLESICGQSRLPDLVSIYDDGSSDNTLQVIADCAPQFSALKIGLKVVRNPSNLGYIANFAKGIENAVGDLLFFCDQDDRWHPDKVRILAEMLETSGADLAFSDGQMIDSAGRRLPGGSILEGYGLKGRALERFATEAVPRLLKRNYINGAALAIHRQLAQAALPIPTDTPHDYWMAIRSALGGGVMLSPQRLYDYRQHGRNVIGGNRLPWRYQLLGLWHSAHRSRMIEYRRFTHFLPFLREIPRSRDFLEKQAWLARCVGQYGRFNRLVAVMKSMLDGSYGRFGTVNHLCRDLVSIVRNR